jgi:hypothetical protein
MPAHRHNGDQDCPLGSGHRIHCVFPDDCPDECVVSGEPHEHCSAFTPPSDMFSPSTTDSTQGHLENCADMAGNLSLDSPFSEIRSTPDSTIDEDYDFADEAPLVCGLDGLLQVADDNVYHSFDLDPSPLAAPFSFDPEGNGRGLSPPAFFDADIMDLEGTGFTQSDITKPSGIWSPVVHLHTFSSPEPPEMQA